MINYIMRKVCERFDWSRDYKLLRKMQILANPPLKKGYQDFEVDLESRKIRVRVFNKVSNEKEKVIIFFHGGGWVAGSIESYTNILATISKKTDYAVIAVDYRLAPEYKFPCGFDDCYEVTKLVRDRVGSKNIILMGDSAGGNLVAAVSQKLKDEHEFRIRNQILLYPALSAEYDKNSKFNSVSQKDAKYLLNQKHLEEIMSQYVEDESDLDNPYVAPLKSKKLWFAPRTLIITCERDPLKDEGYQYYKSLRKRFNYVQFYHFKDADHGFLTNPIETKNTKKTIEIIKKFLD